MSIPDKRLPSESPVSMGVDGAWDARPGVIARTKFLEAGRKAGVGGMVGTAWNVEGGAP